MSDRGTQFTSRFWKKFQEAMGTKLSFSTAFHPQTGGQTERVNQILEDMLRACVLAYGAKWEDCLPFAKFSYNNSYQSSLQMAPFEVLYGRKCRTPLNWSETGEGLVFGPDILRKAEEQVQLVRERLKTAKSRQKSYADTHRRQVDFQVRDHVYLRVTPLKGTKRFHVKGKLAPRFIGPSRSPHDMEKWLTSWNCHLNYLMCTMYSTCHNSGSASKSQTSLIFTRTSITKPLTFSPI